MKYDVAVLGGGPGGYIAAIRCAKLGLKTALIEKNILGGTCLNRGCIPTKSLLHGAACAAAAKNAGASVVPDFAKISKTKDLTVRRLTGGVAFLEKAYGVDTYQAEGKLAGANLIAIGEATIECGNIILATGSVPSIPPVPGADGDRVLTSDDVLTMTELPESIVIAGGGVIGLEFATFFSDMGTKVTIVEMLPELLPGIDRDIVKVICQHLKRKGVEIFTGAKITAVKNKEDGVIVSFETAEGADKDTEAAYCAMCTGRRPATKDIGLENAGLTTDRRGFIETDEHMQTSVPGIYAIGDITGKIQLAHVASEQGMVAAVNCAGGNARMDYNAVPACIYTAPELAYVGENPYTLKEKGIAFKTGSCAAAANGRAMTLGETDGTVKIYASEKGGKVLGAQILAPCASEMITEITTIMHFGGTLDDMYGIIHPHPSLSEMIIEAALDANSISCNQPPKM